MTHTEHTVLRYHLDQLATLLATDAPDVRMHLDAVRSLTRDAHGAADHAPRRGRKKKMAAPTTPEMEARS